VTKTYTLRECLQTGLERNYSVRIARGEQRIAQVNANAANAGFLPEITLGAGYNAILDQRDRDENRDGTQVVENNVLTTAASAGLDLSWTISGGFSVIANYQRLKELEAIGELSARVKIEDFVASLTAEYYNHIQQTIRAKNYKYAVELSRERLRIVEARYLLGGGGRLEVLQARVDFNADSSRLITQKELLITSKIRLNELMAAENLDEDFAVRDSLIDIDETLRWDRLYDDLMTSSAALEQAERGGKLARYELKAARSRHYPYIRLNAGYGYALTTYDRGVAQKNHRWGPDAGITLGFNIFNGPSYAASRSAKIAADNAVLRASEVETALKADLSTFWQAYQNNIQLLSLERENLVSARQNYEIASDRYMIGALSGIEMREAQKSLLDAEERLLVASYNTKICEISLLQVSGRSMDYLSE
jgi:outer membrane protein TolC